MTGHTSHHPRHPAGPLPLRLGMALGLLMWVGVLRVLRVVLALVAGVVMCVYTPGVVLHGMFARRLTPAAAVARASQPHEDRRINDTFVDIVAAYHRDDSHQRTP